MQWDELLKIDFSPAIKNRRIFWKASEAGAKYSAEFV
jgi:hypothetical protein